MREYDDRSIYFFHTVSSCRSLSGCEWYLYFTSSFSHILPHVCVVASFFYAPSYRPPHPPKHPPRHPRQPAPALGTMSTAVVATMPQVHASKTATLVPQAGAVMADLRVPLAPTPAKPVRSAASALTPARAPPRPASRNPHQAPLLMTARAADKRRVELSAMPTANRSSRPDRAEATTLAMVSPMVLGASSLPLSDRAEATQLVVISPVME